MKKILKWLGLVILLLMGVFVTVYFIYLRPFLYKMKHTEVVQIDKNLTVIIGGGGNSGILNSDSLVVVIDTKMDDAAVALHKQVMDIARNKPVLVINTHFHPDHVGGNRLYTGADILSGGSYSKDDWLKEAGEESLPNRWVQDKLVIPMGTDTLTVFNLAKNIHTQSDVMVYFHQRKLIFGGDVILNKQAPVLMGLADGDAYIEVLNSLPQTFEMKTIVPGHGAIGGMEVISDFKQFFSDMKIAAANPEKEGALIDKYANWNQLPLFMSPSATMSHFRKKANQKK